ncbi:MAG: DUF4124 domain-containing protein [Betaproteobacteria bacterium]|jgi:hypothetical protein|nr:DUF4124 domain-containing protein [Betaproteobacteria bacterium]
MVRSIGACVPASLCLLVAAAIVSASAAADEIYKWKDKNGVVHYSNSPPPKDANASVLDESKGKVSVVPGYKPPDGATVPGGDPALQDRVRRLERQLEQERQSQSASTQSQADAYEQWRTDCLAQRRTDCDDPNAAVAPVYGGYPVPPVVRPPGRPVRPSAPSGAPPGYTVGPGPGGIGGQYVPNPPRPIPNGNEPLPSPRPVPR